MTRRVLSAEIKHETNTFSCHPTGLKEYREELLAFGADALALARGTNTEVAGFIEAAKELDWELDHVVSASAQPGGRVTSEALNAALQPILERLRAAQEPYDGIILALHGAMVAECDDDSEGKILREIRAETGDAMPIAVSLDLHANVSVEMCRLADIMVSYATNPHVDMRETGAKAARLLDRMMKGEISPRVVLARCPMLEEVDGARTDTPRMAARLAALRDYEHRDDVFAASINGAMAWADTAHTGPTVVITCQGDLAAHRAFAEEIARDIWNGREASNNDFLTPREAAECAAAWSDPRKPLVINEYADNPGGGAYGDATALLAALLEADCKDACFGPLYDPQSVARLSGHRPGDMVELALGGKTDPGFGGGPLPCRGMLVSLHDGQYRIRGKMMNGVAMSFGPTAVLRVEGIDILVVSVRCQIFDGEQFRAFGIEPEKKRVVALKSMDHFRADFTPIAGRIVTCDSGALCSPSYRNYPFTRVRRPIHPLDAVESPKFA